MTAAADDAVANVTRAIDDAFPGEDVVVVMQGDNGGIPGSGHAGSNCADVSSTDCLRGMKGTVWEGGVRNNALVCSDTLLPKARRGTVYSQGLVHVVDLHATFLQLAGIDPQGDKPLDGVSVWDALIADTPSPRTEFLVNIDPVDPYGQNKTWAYVDTFCADVEGEALCAQWKYVDTPVNASWYPAGTSDIPYGVEHAVGLYNLTADPGEHVNLVSLYPTVVDALVAKLEALEAVAVTPCNLPGGTCASEDLRGLVLAEREQLWLPWVEEQ